MTNKLLTFGSLILSVGLAFFIGERCGEETLTKQIVEQYENGDNDIVVTKKDKSYAIGVTREN